MTKNNLYIGLMTGTSIDAIDAVIAEIDNNSIKQIGCYSQLFTGILKQNIQRLLTPSYNDLNLMLEVDRELGNVYVEAVTQLLDKYKMPSSKINAIGLHGQTIRHFPSQGITLQIGNPNIVSAKTGITTICDFRRKDMAKGGQGAPFAPLFHEKVFRSEHKMRAIINLGGICNITILPHQHSNQPTIGYDIGPANTLLDNWAQRHINQDFDKNGDWAKQGDINLPLLQQMLSDPYFIKPPPKSTGQEYFNIHWLEDLLTNFQCFIKAVDIQRTLLELTATLISTTLQNYDIHETYLCGGGAYNIFLIECLKTLNPQCFIATTSVLGIEPHWVEAMLCAWLAKMTFCNEEIDAHAITGANIGKSIFGGVYH